MGSIASNLRSGKLCECIRATDTSEDDEEEGLPVPGPHITNLNHEQDLSHSLRQEHPLPGPHITNLNHEQDLSHSLRQEQERVSNLSDSILVQILREEHEFLQQQHQEQEPISNLPDQIPSTSPNDSNLEVLHIDDTSFFSPEKDMFFYDFRRFEKFLDGLIPQLRTLPSITSLIFSCRYSYDSQYVHSLIYTVLERNVQKLDISYFLEGFVLPLCIFECSTVMDLNLHMHSCKLDIRTPIHHPNLQILRLSGIVFANCQDVIFDFPVLKVFKLKDCTWSNNVQVVKINTPSAERFVLKHCEGEDEYSLCTIEIWAQSVTKLTLLTSQLVEFIQPPTTDLVHKASIGLGITPASTLQLCNQMYLRACGILEHLNGVKCLKLHMDTMLVLRYGGNFAASLPMFDKLVHLEIDTPETKFGVLLNILHKSPFLEFLVCKTSLSIDEDYVASQVVPQCLVYHLKKVTLMAFNGGEGDFLLAKYFLKNARILEQIKISMMPRLWHSKNMMEKVEEQLSKCAMASSHVEIESLKHENTVKNTIPLDIMDQFFTSRYFHNF